ncbi:MAG: hypothetical protein WCV86_01450 [Patescibacteria group bacterium]|jgi:alpha-amylase/alpha-mannosidase (GH57 family)
MKLTWANFFHIYQPPDWDPKIIRKVSRESYEPFFAFLIENDHVRVTLNMTGSLLVQLLQHNITEPLGLLKRLLMRGQIQITGTPKYHPLAPLLPFHHVRRQITQHHDLLREYFNMQLPLAGFYPPEMAISPDLLTHIAREGFTWVITDDFLIPKGQTLRPQDGAIFEHTNLRIVFRNHVVSDYLGFFGKPGETGKHLQEVITKETGQDTLILTAMDGENLGHHRPESLPMWKTLVSDQGIETITVSEYLERQQSVTELIPASGSWSTLPEDIERHIAFPLWKDPENPIHMLQWRLTDAVLAVADRCAENDHATFDAIDRAVISDQYWWASAKPWWDRDLVIRLADRMADSVERLDLNAAEREEIRETVREIHSMANEWQEKGIAQKHRAAFLAKESGVRYFGGERITNTWGSQEH